MHCIKYIILIRLIRNVIGWHDQDLGYTAEPVSHNFVWTLTVCNVYQMGWIQPHLLLLPRQNDQSVEIRGCKYMDIESIWVKFEKASCTWFICILVLVLVISISLKVILL